MDQQNKLVGVVGRKGSGKSTLAKDILISETRLVVQDTMGEYDVIADTITDPDMLRIYLDAVKDSGEKFQVRFIPQEEDEIEQFTQVCRHVYECGNLTFGIEEVPGLVPSITRVQPAFSRIIRLGRHKKINTLWTAQRAAEVPIALRSATDLWILFQQTEPRDLQAVEERTDPETAQVVTNLGLHGFVLFDVIGRTQVSEQEYPEVDPLKPGPVVLRNNDPLTRNALWRGTSNYGEN